MWKYVIAGGQVQISNQLTGANAWIIQNELEEEIVHHADFAFGDKEFVIETTDEKDVGAIRQNSNIQEVHEEMENYESGDDDYLVLNI